MATEELVFTELDVLVATDVDELVFTELEVLVATEVDELVFTELEVLVAIDVDVDVDELVFTELEVLVATELLVATPPQISPVTVGFSAVAPALVPWKPNSADWPTPKAPFQFRLVAL